MSSGQVWVMPIAGLREDVRRRSRRFCSMPSNLLEMRLPRIRKTWGLKAALATYLAKVGDKDQALAELKLIEPVPNKEAIVLFQSAIA